ncbi:hypothetical protein ABIF38_008700 [Bradyrhizobium japonicum]|uniref:Uncharacterized protein n=1 Tax=Bradyrhizobium elkanii TaxID=29448 RepID=A0A4Y3ZVQ1_BRAEL|nr:hypothetical protein [Bradyrhizobium elkanii]MBP1299737.1 hypothetical protein [Bradyrhizobium elkanii]MBP2428793.1 hypothetical protein [Bradyrhizobium elkanii]MCP1728984.1 hypothetical protein [Bradyrhizobium elkanii]MCP1972028.1 hypothetical protein [Bradyrhizobium elkanii]MCS3519196.1 hypothetical protein [Bradyrhizobium elkanii]
MKKTRNRAKQTTSLQDRLNAFADDIFHKAARLPPGIERDQLLKRARTAEIAADIDQWVSSSGLQSPT